MGAERENEQIARMRVFLSPGTGDVMALYTLGAASLALRYPPTDVGIDHATILADNLTTLLTDTALELEHYFMLQEEKE